MSPFPLSPEGLAYWRDQVWNPDGGPENVVAGMIGSPEFFSSAGGTNSGWVQALYRRLLGREAEPEGLAFWRDALDQGRMTRERVVLGFVQSDENFRNLIHAWHQQYLDRQARADELAQYLAQMRTGASHRLIQIALIDTVEYRSRPALPPPGTVGRL